MAVHEARGGIGGDDRDRITAGGGDRTQIGYLDKVHRAGETFSSPGSLAAWVSWGWAVKVRK